MKFDGIVIKYEPGLDKIGAGDAKEVLPPGGGAEATPTPPGVIEAAAAAAAAAASCGLDIRPANK